MKKDIHVVGAVIFRDGKILCAQRGNDKSLPLLWEFPGGKIEKGETAKQALLREIQEEMKVSIVVNEQIEHTVYEYDFGIVHLTTFACELINEEPTLTEHAAIKWLTPDELHLLEWAPTQMYLLLKN